MRYENAACVSVVIPVFGSAESLVELTQRLSAVLDKLVFEYEIIFVDDGGGDENWALIQQLAVTHSKVVGIQLSRNFGQNHAILAGLDRSVHDWVIVMDCDLQDRPEEIPALFNAAIAGYDQVVAIRQNRSDRSLKRFSSSAYVWFLRVATGQRVTQGTANFGVYSRQVIDAIRSVREHSQPFGLAAIWVGFRRLEIAVEHSPRAYGTSTYNVRKLVRLALEGMTTSSDRPLRLTVLFGALISLSSIAGFGLAAVFAVLKGAPPSGWISLIAFQVLTLGLLMTTLGIVGVYVGQTFTQTKHRPRYVIRTTTALGRSEET